MNQSTWNQLTPEQQASVRSMSSRFIKAVKSSTARDGMDFGEKYFVQRNGGQFVITDGRAPLAGVAHSDREVIDALFLDAIGNYGR